MIDRFMFDSGPKRIDDCSREELLIVVKCLSVDLERLQRQSAEARNMFAMVRQAANGRHEATLNAYKELIP